MNKKGAWAWYEIVMLVLAILFFTIVTIGMIKASKNYNSANECKPEDCYVRTYGCPTNELEFPYKCEDDDTHMCCLSLDEQAKYNKGTKPGDNAPVPGINQVGNLYITLGESSAPVSGSKTLTAGEEYTFKILADGNITSCKIVVVEIDTGDAVKGSWVSIPGETDCKSVDGARVKFTPGIAQINKEYRMEIEGKNSSTTNNRVKISYINLKVIQPVIN